VDVGNRREFLELRSATAAAGYTNRLATRLQPPSGAAFVHAGW